MSPPPDSSTHGPLPGSRPPRARIDLDALAANCRLARKLAGEARVLAVVKADAYGHGAVAAARALAGPADAFAVARVEEGLALRRAGVEAPIVILQGCLGPGELAAAMERRLEPVIHRRDQLEELTAALAADAGSMEQRRRVWLMLDTGMRRLGFGAEDFGRAWQTLARAPGVSEVVATSHLACADETGDDFTHTQMQRFARGTEGLSGPRSLAHSAALMTLPASRHDWVRPGIMLYGASPLAAPHPAAAELRPVMRLEAEVIAVRWVDRGEGVGYGRRFVAAAPTRVGTVGIGYGDGYPRAAPDGTPVAVAGRRARLIGRVSMDSLAIDLTELPEADVGARVELWGEEVKVEEVAEACATISYELLSRVAARVPRVFQGGPS